jgi:hypothetical protein
MTDKAQDYVIDWLAAHGPEEWHRVAQTWNWDAGYRILNWIVDQKACDKGTALHLFWLGSPDYFLKFRNRDDVLAKSGWSVDNYDFLVRVLTHWRAGRYKTALFATEQVAETAKAYAHVESHHDAASLPWVVPDDMRRDIQGRVVDHAGYAEGYSPALQAKLNAEGIPF